jgi:hypothetical protein
MSAGKALRAIAGIIAVPLGVIVALGLMDMLRGVPGPALALTLPLRETGHDDGASVFVVVIVSALVFALVSGLADGRRRAPATAIARSLGVLGCALALQAVSLQLVRQATVGFAWEAAAGSPAPYVCALGAVLGTLAAQMIASSDRWRRRGLAERPVDGPTQATPLAKIGS